jgi:hypothetical protein
MEVKVINPSGYNAEELSKYLTDLYSQGWKIKEYQVKFVWRSITHDYRGEGSILLERVT